MKFEFFPKKPQEAVRPPVEMVPDTFFADIQDEEALRARLAEMAEQHQQVQGSDGRRHGASELLERVEVIGKEGMRMAKENPEKMTADQIDDFLSRNGVTRAGGFRTALQTIIENSKSSDASEN